MKNLELGMSASCSRTFSEGDRKLFMKLSGEKYQPDEAGKHPIPEPLIGGLFSYLLGTELPGFGTNYLKQQMTFTGKGFYNETLTATVKITRLRPEKHLVNLETTCTNAAGKTICHGEALVLTKDVKGK